MSTTMTIAKLNRDGTSRLIRVYYDGYPDYAMPILQKYYATTARVDALLDLGDLSELKADLKKCEVDRDNNKARTIPQGEALRGSDGWGTDYFYVYTNGHWYCI